MTRFNRSFLFAVIVATVVTPSVFAASLTQFAVIPDGSSDPPGDRIDLEVLFDSNQDSVGLEVRAFVVSEQKASPVMARGERHRDADGLLVVKTEFKSPANAGKMNASVTIPYSDLALSIGQHLIGYELTGLKDGKTSFVCATPLSIVQVTEVPRTKMLHRVGRRVASQKTAEVTVFSIENSIVSERTVERTVTEQPMVFEMREVETNIANGFLRHSIRDIASTDPDEDPVEAHLKSLKKRAWTPVRHKVMYFATNRKLVNPSAVPAKRFNSEISSLISYGSCLVNIPTELAHERGRLETPGWWGADPEKHFLIDAMNPLDPDRFYEAVTSVLRDTASPADVLVFVHGYNNAFEFAVLRAAQVVHDMRFPGSTMVFSWPSQGTINGYRTDETNAAASIGSLTAVLERLAILRKDTTGNSNGKIHVIAHSMGNRVLLGALQQLSSRLQAGDKPFGNIILAAPDIAVLDFSNQITHAIRLADNVSTYFCAEDRALITSRHLHHRKRAGEGLVPVTSLVNINADKANTTILGHDYFASNSLLLIDLDMLINDSTPPTRRPTIRDILEHNVMGMDYRYWFFP